MILKLRFHQMSGEKINTNENLTRLNTFWQEFFCKNQKKITGEILTAEFV